MRSHVWMTIGLAAGLVLGLAAATTQHPVLVTLAASLRPLGTLFLNLLSMVVIPLVVTALFAGVAGLGSIRRVGRLGIRTLGFFWATTLAAILIGFAVAALFLPLAAVTPDQQAALRQAALADSGLVRHAAEQIPTGARFLVELIPANPVRAAVDGNLLPLIVFTTIFAVAAAGLPEEKRRTLTDLAAAHVGGRRRAGPQALAALGDFRAPAGRKLHPVGERPVPGGRVSVRRPPVRGGPRRARDDPSRRRGVSGFAHGRQRSVGEYREPGTGVHRDGIAARRTDAAHRARPHPRHVSYDD